MKDGKVAKRGGESENLPEYSSLKVFEDKTVKGASGQNPQSSMRRLGIFLYPSSTCG
jgi:hypothetical protein